jgi:D-sedoheptulose 7-phosphate isomerase
MDLEKVGQLLEVCNQARLKGNTIFFAGNGGSASTASHFACDFLGANVKRKISPPYQVVSLCDNNAIITAFGNDFGYEKIFLNQLLSLYREGDVLVVISASGNSPNVVEAVEWVNEKGGTTFGLVGFDGGKLHGICTHSLLCDTKKGEYGPVEDIHMIVDHIINVFVLENQ